MGTHHADDDHTITIDNTSTSTTFNPDLLSELLPPLESTSEQQQQKHLQADFESQSSTDASTSFSSDEADDRAATAADVDGLLPKSSSLNGFVLAVILFFNASGAFWGRPILS